MKRIVQRLALAFLLLLPMLANAATLTYKVNYTARGTASIIPGTGAGEGTDTLAVTVYSGYEIKNAESWFNNGTLVVPGSTTGLDVVEIEGNVYKLPYDNSLDWDFLVKIFPTHPTLTITDPHGTLSSSTTFTFGVNVELTTTSSTIDDGYTFAGWINYADPLDLTDTISKVDPYEFRITDDTAILVGYKAATRHLVLNTNYVGAAHHPQLTYKINGEDYTIGDVYEIEHGTTATITVTGAGVAPFQFMDDGAHFGIWGRDNDLDGTDDVTDYNVTATYSFTVTSDVNVTCYLDPTVTYDVTAKGEDDDDLGSVAVTPAGPFAWGDTVTLTATPNDASQAEFKWWLDNTSNTDNSRKVVATADIQYIAHFDYNKYKINVTGDGYTFTFKDNLDNVIDTTGGVEWGRALVITANPPTGMLFEKWSDENTDNPRTIYPLTADVTLVALSQTTGTVAVAIDDAAHGSVEVVGDATVNFGENVTVRANEDYPTKYFFKEWRNGSAVVSTENTYTFALTENVTLTAYYDTMSYAITVTGGTATPATVKYMANFTLTATPVDGYTFNHWELNSLSVATTTPANFTLDAPEARTYVAVNTADDFNVTANVNDALMGSVNGVNNPYHVGDLVNLTAEPTPHHHLVKWNDNSTNASISFTMPANDTIVTATFGIDSVTVTVASNDALMGSATINSAASDIRPYGTSVETLVAANPASADYEFVKWQVAGADINIATWTVPETAVTLTAIFKHVDVTVNTVADPDVTTTSIDPASPEFGDHVHLHYVPVEGYTFQNWTLQGSDVVIVDSTNYEIAATTTNLVAHFTINTYNVSIDVNEALMGTAQLSAATADYNTNVTLTAVANPGYVLEAWKDNNGTALTVSNENFNSATRTYTAELTITKDTEVVAYFNYEPLSITAEIVDSAAAVDFTSRTTTYGTPNVDGFTFTGNNIIGGIITTEAPAITGWHFWKWNDESGKANPRVDTLTSSDPVTYTAIYAIDSFTVTLVNNYGTDVTLTGAGRYAYGTDASINYTVATAKADSLSFTKWGAADANTDSPRIVTVVSDITFTPVFGVIEYTVNATTDGHGTITYPATLPVEVAYGQTTTLTAEANHGYQIVNWTNNVNTDELSTLTITPKITGDVTWTANFEKTDYTVTAVVKDVAGNEQPTMATVTGAGDYEFEASATLSYTAADGFTFVKWIGEGTGEEATTATITFDVNNDTTIIAQFDTMTTTVTAVADDAAHGTVTVSNGTPKYFTTVTLSVDENPGYEFKYWADDNTNTDNPRTIDVTFGTTHSYTAVFEPRQYIVTVATADETMGAVAITGTTYLKDTVDFGTTVEIVANPETGYSFDKWNGSVATATYSYTVEAKDTTFTATFTPNNNDLTITSSNIYRGGVRFGTTGDSVETDTRTVAFNETTHIEALPAYGYAFDSWSDDATAPAKRDYVFTTDADVSLTANFVYAPYTIKVNLNDATLATIELNGTEVENGAETSFGYTDHVTVTVTPVANYHIVNGTTPYTNANPLTFGVDVLDNLEYNYTIVPDTFSVTINVNDITKGHIENFTNGDFAYGDVIAGVEAVADGSNTFANWSNGATTTTLPDVVVVKDTTITANFAINTYDFTVVSEDNAKGTVAGSLTGVDHGTNVTATATAAEGYDFGNWTDQNNTVVSTVNPFTFALTTDTTLTAHFVNKTYSITASTFTPERGWVSVTNGDDYYEDQTGNTLVVPGLPTHTPITVTATANTGYHFVNWDDDATAAATRTIELTNDTNIMANFAYDTYTVTWNANVAGRGTIETLGTVAYHFGAVDTLKATPAAGYIFQKWEDGATTNPRYYTVNGDAALTAIFIYDTTTDAVAACDSYVWGGHTYTVTEVAPAATLQDDEGYDSIVVMTVNINYSSTNDVYADECVSYTWTEGDGLTYTSTQDVDYIVPAGNNAGCDSTVTLHLTIKQPVTGIDEQEHCVSYTWINGATYTESTSTVDTTLLAAAQNGCDSTVTLHLTINQPSAGIDVQEHCDSYEWIDNVTYTESTNTPSVVLPNANQYGCDSTVTLNLTIFQSTGDKTVESVCDTYTWDVNDNIYTASGVYTFGHLNGSSCYVVDTLDLTIRHNTSTAFADQNACGEYLQTWTDGTPETITISGMYFHSYTSTEGCPSMDSIFVVVRPFATGTDVHHDICDSFTWELNGETYTESNNTATATLAGAAANGCDSVVTLDLTINHNTSNVYSVDICVEKLIEWGDGTDTTVTTSGVYTHDYVTAQGCPSTDEVTVTILEPTAAVDEQHACNSFTWIDNVTYTESNDTATMTLFNAAGCDSVVTLNLTITYDQEVEVSDTACDSYEWNGLTFTTSRDVVYSTTDQYGCDSVTTLHLVINNSNEEDFDTSAYGQFIWNGEPYQATGDYEQTLTNIYGCDSVVTMHLTINEPDYPSETVEACDSLTWKGHLYTESGTYYDTVRAINGADSVISALFLAIYHPDLTGTETATACGSYTWHDSTYTVSCVDTFQTKTIHDCDSLVTLTLTINNATTSAETLTVCDSTTWNGTVYTTSGTYTYTTTNAANCDSTVTLTLTVNSATTGVDVQTACSSYTWINGETYTENNNTATYTTTNAAGCDSVVTLNLTVNQPVATAVIDTVCDSLVWNGTTYTTSGTYTWTGIAANTCDSVVTLTLTVNSATSSEETLSVCDTYTWNGTAYSTSGTYTYTTTNVAGCDSVATLNLTVGHPNTGIDQQTACGSYTWIDGVTYTASNITATYTTTNASGCDSVITLNLTINQPTSSIDVQTACGSYTWNGNAYTTSGTYTYNGTNAAGCDSVANLVLIINTPDNTTESATACDTYTWTLNNTTYTTSGTYTYDFTDANGCAATTTLNLTINNSVSNTVALSGVGSVDYNGVTYTEDAVVTTTYTAANGCDSTVTATITVIPEVVTPDSVTVYISTSFPAHGTVTPNTYANYAIGDTVIATATADSGYQFAYWVIGRLTAMGISSDTVTDNPVNYVITADDTNYAMMTFMAEFESISGVEDSMTVILATADATMGTTNPVPGTYRLADGDSIIFSAVANTGYQFLYWIRETQYTAGGQAYVDTLFGESYQINAQTWLIESIASYTAYFEVDTNYVPDTVYHFVTLMSSDATMGTVSASDSVADGETFTATATAYDGYHFVSWSNGGVIMSTDNPYTFVVNADITLTANFEADPIDTVYYNVTVNYDATMGTVTGEGRYMEGTIVTLRAAANTGYHFVAWYDGNNQMLASTLEYTFTVSADMTFSAEFAADPVYYTVTGEPNDPTMGYVTGSAQYEEGATANLTAQAYEGYHFVSWSNGETTPTISFTVTCDVTYIAYFEANEPPQAIDETDMSNVTIYSADSRIIILGAEGMDINVYDINGRTISNQMNAGETVEFRMATTGVYLVKVGNAPAKRVLVVR